MTCPLRIYANACQDAYAGKKSMIPSLTLISKLIRAKLPISEVKPGNKLSRKR